MSKFVKISIVSAEPTNWYELTSPSKYLPDCPGYLVKSYPDSPGTWVPKDLFEKQARPINELTFAFAIELVKRGVSVRDKKWVLGMYLQYFQEESKRQVPSPLLNAPKEAHLVVYVPADRPYLFQPKISDILDSTWEVEGTPEITNYPLLG